MSTWIDWTPVDSAEDLLRTSVTHAGDSFEDLGATGCVPLFDLLIWIISKKPAPAEVIKVFDENHRALCRRFSKVSPGTLAEVLHRVVAAAAKELDREAPFYAQSLRSLVPKPYNEKPD